MTNSVRSQAVSRALEKAGLGRLSVFQGKSFILKQMASHMLGAHHTAITQYLSEQLAELSSMQTTMQQRRVDMQRQRYEKLADSAQQPTAQTNIALSEESLRGSIGAMGEDGVDIAEQISAEQRQVFEDEASALVQSLQADLAAVQHAEQQLHDISSLQTRIVQHLEEQNEHIDMLLSEAGTHGEQVTRGNDQLRRAKERNRQANRYLSLFFVLSGMFLLLMHCTCNITNSRFGLNGVSLMQLFVCAVFGKTKIHVCAIAFHRAKVEFTAK